MNLEDDSEEYILEMITGTQKTILLRLIRGIAPITISEIMKKIPLRSILLVYGGRALISIDINVRGERSVKEVLKGDITYSSINKSIIIYLEDHKPTMYETKIGNVLNTDELKHLKSGIGILLRRKH